MSKLTGTSHPWKKAATALALCAASVTTVAAADTAGSARSSKASALSVLIKRLSANGALSKADQSDLQLLMEADEAEDRAREAELQAALARATAAEARARAVMALSAGVSERSVQQEPVAEEAPAPVRRRAEPVMRKAEPIADEAETVAEAAPKPVVRRKAASGAPLVDVSDLEDGAPSPRVALAPTRTRATTEVPVAAAKTEPVRPLPEPPAPVVSESDAGGPENAPGMAASEDAPEQEEVERKTVVAHEDEDAIHVTYVPDVVKDQLREEVKQEVLEEARQEGWATPRSVPDWLARFRFYGDFRFRGEGQFFPSGNAAGSFVNYNAINTGAPYDTGTSNTVPAPKLNMNEQRQRMRVRARLGTAIDLNEGFTSGLRFATGENNSPVTQNQSLGAAGNGQGGNFSKYAVWLDRAFLRYQTGGMPDDDFNVSVGRFDNPFMSTSVIWADDLGFDGAEIHGRQGITESITPFYSVGAFPVFNTDLNFASNNSTKFKSTDKWLYAAQLGSNFDLGEKISAKFGVAYYFFKNVEGRFSTPFTPLSASDAGDTDSLRPAFAQKGNTYMPLREITPVSGSASQGGNDDGKSLQYQYFGLASKFRPLAIDGRVEFNHFAPFQIVLSGEYIKNLGFNRSDISSKAINNLGPDTTVNGQTVLGPYLGTDSAWITNLTIGRAALQKRWDWNLTLGYRRVGSDAVIDGFTDSDFGGGGTNLKGLSVSANLAITSRVYLGLKWLSATQVSGDAFKNDVIQADVNGKF